MYGTGERQNWCTAKRAHVTKSSTVTCPERRAFTTVCGCRSRNRARRANTQQKLSSPATFDSAFSVPRLTVTYSRKMFPSRRRARRCRERIVLRSPRHMTDETHCSCELRRPCTTHARAPRNRLPIPPLRQLCKSADLDAFAQIRACARWLADEFRASSFARSSPSSRVRGLPSCTSASLLPPIARPPSLFLLVCKSPHARKVPSFPLSTDRRHHGRRNRASSTATKYNNFYRGLESPAARAILGLRHGFDDQHSGMIGCPENVLKVRSLMETFFTPTMRFSRSISTIRSTIRKG